MTFKLLLRMGVYRIDTARLFYVCLFGSFLILIQLRSIICLYGQRVKGFLFCFRLQLTWYILGLFFSFWLHVSSSLNEPFRRLHDDVSFYTSYYS